MAIAAADFTLLYLILNYIERLATTYQDTYIIRFFTSHMVELKNDRI